jgi:hypothetical protein
VIKIEVLQREWKRGRKKKITDGLGAVGGLFTFASL